MIEQPEQWHAVGRRKSAVARAYLRPGTGKITINGREFEDYVPRANLRMLVMDCADKDGGEAPAPTCVINPEILLKSDDMGAREEGCLSFPGMFADVERPAEVRVRYLDQNGKEHERDFDGLWATCMQHEIDHLNGTLFIDHLSALKRQRINTKMKKMKRELARGD